MKYFVWFIIIPLLFLSCKQKEEKNTTLPTLGKYIYRDDNDIHHINPRCMKLRHGKDDAGHEIYAMHPMDTSRFTIIRPEYFRVCSRCVNIEEYEHMLRISERNSQDL